MSSGPAHHVAGVSVPANLLIMGEYAVLEEGGLGFAVAPDIRVAGTLSRTEEPGAGGRPLTATGRIPGSTFTWPGDTGLFGRAADYLAERLPPPGTGGAELLIDSSDLYGPGGKKRGLGSSAAAVVAMTALWTAAVGEPQTESGRLFPLALGAHREAQGGRGSGYDVACSCYGGTLLFTGGQEPLVRRVSLPWMPSIRIFSGRAPVRTVSAVGCYREWSWSHPEPAREFLRESNRLVSEFCAASGWEEALGILTTYRELVLKLGRVIGVAADIAPPPATAEHTGGQLGALSFVKAVGAGNELGIVMAPHSDPAAARRGTELLKIAERGVEWQ